MRTADSRYKATGFLAVAALAIAMAPAQGAYAPSDATVRNSVEALDITVTGAPGKYGYTVAMPVSTAPATPAKSGQGKE